MLTILAGEPLASMMIVLMGECEYLFHLMTNCQCCVVECQVWPGPGLGDRDCLGASLALCTSSPERKPESF